MAAMKPERSPLDRSPFSLHLGVELLEHAEGRSRVRLVTEAHHLNAHDVLHGGVTYCLADTAMGLALYSQLADDEACATIDNTIVYMRPVTGGELIARGRVLHRSRRLASLEAEVEHEGRLIAKTMASFAIMPRRA